MELDKSNRMDSERIPFDEAIDKTGYGLYSALVTGMTSLCVISFYCISYGSPFLVPTSACELETTVSQQGLLAAGPVLGLILGAFCWGYFADTRGRRPVLLVCLAGAAILNLIATISVNWIMMLVLQFVSSIFASGLYSISMSLLSESVPVAKKNVVVLLVASIALLSQGIMALLSLPIIPLSFSYYLPALGIYWNSWRLLMLVFCLPSILAAVSVFFIKESPKFVYAKGNEEGALQILRTIHRINNLRSNEEFQVKSLLMEVTVASAPKASVKEQIVPLFKAPYLKYTIIMTTLFVSQQLCDTKRIIKIEPVVPEISAYKHTNSSDLIGAFLIWLPTIADQFVRILQTGEGHSLSMCALLNLEPAASDADAVPCALDQTSLLIVFGVGASQSLVNICISLWIGFVGRRNMVLGLSLVCGVSGILVNLIPNIIGSAVFFIILLQAIIAIGLYTALIVALFPTHLRTMAIAFAMTGARIGTATSVQILNLLLANYCDVGFYLFASIFAASGILACFLPDDRKVQPASQGPFKGVNPPEGPNRLNDGQYRNLTE